MCGLVLRSSEPSRTLVAVSASLVALAALLLRRRLRPQHQQQTVHFGPQPRGAAVVVDDQIATILGEEVQGEFRLQAQLMPAISRLLLLEGGEPSHVRPEALFADLLLQPDVETAARLGLASSSAVLRRTGVLTTAACARLRAAVDAERRQHCDTVDGAPDEQLNLSTERLEDLIGDARASAALWRLPAEFAAYGDELSRKAARNWSTADAQIFVRRYTAGSRPWNPFHTDSSALTINLALANDDSFEGGELLACYGGEVRTIRRAEGEATVHASTLLHGVSRITSGVRYSLIIFLGRPARSGAAIDRQAEANALSELMVDEAFLERCGHVCGAKALDASRERFAALSTLEAAEIGRTIEKVVSHYGAPHLQPTQILAATRRGESAVCWSLRALLNYAAKIDEVGDE